MQKTKLNLLRRIMMALGAELTIGTCPVCHCLVDLDAEKTHAWWHSQQESVQVSAVTRPIKVGRHMQ